MNDLVNNTAGSIDSTKMAHDTAAALSSMVGIQNAKDVVALAIISSLGLNMRQLISLLCPACVGSKKTKQEEEKKEKNEKEEKKKENKKHGIRRRR